MTIAATVVNLFRLNRCDRLRVFFRDLSAAIVSMWWFDLLNRLKSRKKDFSPFLFRPVLTSIWHLFVSLSLQGSVAYVSQQAWIQHSTVRENILFGKAYDSTRYEQVIDSCALRPDLDILQAGDSTEIGERVCLQIFRRDCHYTLRLKSIYFNGNLC